MFNNSRRSTRKARFFHIAILWALSASLFCQPRLLLDEPDSYQVGDRLDLDSIVLDREGKELRLSEILSPKAEVFVLIIFGGGVKSPPDRTDFRGSLWCEDSFDDLGVQRALVHRFDGRPVEFIPVAVPPVYHTERYGWDDDDFLGQPEHSEVYRKAVRDFIEATEKERETTLLPFKKIYYDPKFRLAQNKEERELGPEFGTIYEWQGKLKWHQDGRRYGTPTIWFINGQGDVLTEPLFGNDYDSEPPEINYGYAEAATLIEELLEKR